MIDPEPPSTGPITFEQSPSQHGHDWTETTPSTTAVEVVAATTNRELTSLPALFEAVDPDALDSICEKAARTREDGELSVSFLYAGCEVTITADGEVSVTPAGEVS